MTKIYNSKTPKKDALDKELMAIIQFKPTWETCYRPDLLSKEKCNMCNFKKYVYCKKSKNYLKVKDEVENQN